ncbi:MAG: hypothetical protein ACT4O4_03990 [Nitrospiraceae bacterium]
MSPATMTSPLTADVVQEVVASLPIQGRIMLRLLLLQYLDVTHDEILYMVSDRPDPRCVSGKKPITTMTQESIAAMISRRDEYRRRARLRRERTWLQCTALAKLARTADTMAKRAAVLLAARSVSAGTIENLEAQARTAVPIPAIRVLEERWEKDEISAEEFQKYRLAIELQTLLRFAERFRKRLDLAEQERRASDQTTLLDHEIAHIWGIPAGTLAARKVKFLSQYLMALQAKLSGSQSGPDSPPPLDLWKETMAVLARTPIERSIVTYDGLERTEAALIEKLTTYVALGIPEAIEVKFWNSLVYGASSNAMHSETTRTLFGLQRLVAIQNDADTSVEAVDQELLKRTTPIPKEPTGVLQLETGVGTTELTDLQKQILHNFVGEDISGRASDKW